MAPAWAWRKLARGISITSLTRGRSVLPVSCIGPLQNRQVCVRSRSSSGLQTQQIQIQRFLRLAVSGVGIVSSLGSGGLTACKGRICFSLWIDVREPRKPERRMCRIGRDGLIGKVTSAPRDVTIKSWEWFVRIESQV